MIKYLLRELAGIVSMLRNIKILTALLFLINTANAQTVSPPTCSINGATITCPNGSLIPGGVPGGSNTQIQFNDSGAFGGISGWTTNGSTLLTGSTTSFLNWTGRAAITSPADGQITLFNNAQTGFTRLNFGGTTSSFPALKVNGTALEARLADDSAYSGFVANSLNLANAGSGIFSNVGGALIFTANTIDQRNGTNAQAFRVYNTYTDSSNYERAIFEWGSNVLTIGTNNAGTGTPRNLNIMAGGNNRWFFQATTGHFLSYMDNTYDIGASGANRPRTIYAGTDLSAGANITADGIMVSARSTAIPAGGNTSVAYKATSTTNFGVFFGSGAPTLSAAKGSLYLRSDGSTTNDRMYVNTDGGTTWTAVITAL